LSHASGDEAPQYTRAGGQPQAMTARQVAECRPGNRIAPGCRGYRPHAPPKHVAPHDSRPIVDIAPRGMPARLRSQASLRVIVTTHLLRSHQHQFDSCLSFLLLVGLEVIRSPKSKRQYDADAANSLYNHRYRSLSRRFFSIKSEFYRFTSET
jgi:hypothetical protein